MFNSILPWSKGLEGKAWGLFIPCCRSSRVLCSYPILLLSCFCSCVLFSGCKTISVGCGSPRRGLSESHFPAVSSCAPYRRGFSMWGPLAGCQASCLVELLYDAFCGHLRAQEAWYLVPASFLIQEAVLNDMSVGLRRARATEGCWIALPYKPMNHAHPPFRLLLIIKMHDSTSLKIDTFFCPQQCLWHWAFYKSKK